MKKFLLQFSLYSYLAGESADPDIDRHKLMFVEAETEEAAKTKLKIHWEEKSKPNEIYGQCYDAHDIEIVPSI